MSLSTLIVGSSLFLLASASRAALALPSSCLPLAQETDIIRHVVTAPFAVKGGPTMKVWETDSREWQAARNAGIAWARGDCEAFVAAARIMSYEASLLRDATTGHSYWVLRDNPLSPSYQGVFVFRAPEELSAARGLVIDAPHMGTDYHADDSRAIQVFRDTSAAAFLQNTASRCSLTTSSGCSQVTSIYACGAGGVRDSDVVHSVRHGFYAVYDGIESVRDYLHFEYHGAARSVAPAGCSATVQLSQASSSPLPPSVDDGTFPHRLWQAFEKNRDPNCVCYHQREKGCVLNGAASTLGRRTNTEVSSLEASPANACLVKPDALAQRFAHFEAYNIDPREVTRALQEAIPIH